MQSKPRSAWMGAAAAAVVAGLMMLGIAHLSKPAPLMWEGPEGLNAANTSYEMDKLLVKAYADQEKIAEPRRQEGRKLASSAKLEFYRDMVLMGAGRQRFSAYFRLADDPNTKAATPEQLADPAFAEGYLQVVQSRLSGGLVTVRLSGQSCEGGCMTSLTWNTPDAEVARF